MILVLLNGEYRISEEYHNNDVRKLAYRTMCSTEGVASESNGENWIKYTISRYKININTTLTENIYTSEGKGDSWLANGDKQHMRSTVSRGVIDTH